VEINKEIHNKIDSKTDCGTIRLFKKSPPSDSLVFKTLPRKSGIIICNMVERLIIIGLK